MSYIGSKVRSSITNVEGIIEGIKKDKILVNFEGNAKIECSLEKLIIPDDVKEEILNELNKNSKKKIATGVFGELDARRSPEQIKNPKTIKELHKGDCLGTRSGDIYNDLTENDNFKWNPEVAWNFGRQRRLYSKNCTPEGYSVWMLAHSSYNNSVSKSERIVNSIMENGDVIETWNENAEMSEYEIGEIRVVFVKNACGQYIFWGLLKTEDIIKDTKQVLHKFIGGDYIKQD